MNTVKHNLKELKSRIISGILLFLVLSWAGFLIFSDVRNQVYGLDRSSNYVSTFIVHKKTHILSVSGGNAEYLELKDKSGRIFVFNGTSGTFYNSVSEGEVVQASINKYNISSVKNTTFQICVMWYSILLPIIILFIAIRYDGMVNDYFAGISALVYFIISIYLIVGLW